MILGHMTNVYARASDSFIRDEVAALRALGHTVYTFSVRRPAESELVADDIRRERANTEYLVDGPSAGVLFRGLGALLWGQNLVAAARLALATAPPGVRGHVWQAAYLLEAALLARSLKARGVQHLHNHIGEGSASVAMLASMLSGVPYSLTIHGPNEFDRPERIAIPAKVGRSAFTASVSHYGRSQIMRWTHPGLWPKIHVVRCGVSERFLGEAPARVPDHPRLVSIGRLAADKGQLVLLEAVDILSRDGIALELVLIGDGPMRGELEAVINRLDLRERVQLLGWRSATEVKHAIRAARAVVQPSFAENLPVVLMEAMALRRPVVTTNVGGIAELVTQDVGGWLVPPGCPTALADAIRQVLELPSETLDALGDAGHDRVAELHDVACEAGHLAALIQQSVASAGLNETRG